MVASRGLAPTDLGNIEAPVTIKAYLLCAFTAFGGIYLGYDSGTGADVFTNYLMQGSSIGDPLFSFIFSVGGFFGALIAGAIADWYGRRPTIIVGCVIYTIGCIILVASALSALIVIGRVIASTGVGFVSAIIILYISEISPRKVRGALISGYRFCITIGGLLASCVTYATESGIDAVSYQQYRIPISIQFVWSLIFGIGLYLLPESPRYFVKKGRVDDARRALSRLRGQPEDSDYITFELAEIVANAEHEKRMIIISGSLRDGSSNVRRTILGMSLLMMQQWMGLYFVVYYSLFLQSTGTISVDFLPPIILGSPFQTTQHWTGLSSFLSSMTPRAISSLFPVFIIPTLVNMLSTPVSFWTIEKIGRRPLLIWGASGMLICQFLVAIIGVTVGFNKNHLDSAGNTVANDIAAVKAQAALIVIYIFFFASSWGPGAWVVIGEIFPLPIRSHGIALSTASSWFWNMISALVFPWVCIALIPGSYSFFILGASCASAVLFAYYLVPETKGLTLEQIDRMLEETTPRTSAAWVPGLTYSQERAGMRVERPEGCKERQSSAARNDLERPR